MRHKKKNTLRLLAIVLVFFLFVTSALSPITSIVSFAEAPTIEGSSTNVRYTVLLLDVSGPETFHEDPSVMNILGLNYTSDASIEEVKNAAKKFLSDAKYTIDKNYIAIVTFSEEAQVVADFTNDLDYLQSVLDAVEQKDEDRSIYAGLKCSYDLLSSVTESNATKNLLICTTGLTDCGEYSYEGRYNTDTIGSNWENEDTKIKLYAYTNSAMAYADMMKDKAIVFYVLGIFSPIEKNMPSNSGLRDITKFFRIVAQDLASSEESFYEVENADELEFAFGELQTALTGVRMVNIFNDSSEYNNYAPVNDQGGSLHLGGHFETFLWGPSLFDVPATRMRLEPLGEPSSPNYNLALLAGSLSFTAYNCDYLHQAYLDLGFEDENISFYSYPSSSLNRPDALRDGNRFADDDELAFSIASQRLQGQDYDLIIITLKGTNQPFTEGVKDITALPSKDFYGYAAWDYYYEFKEDVFAGLEDYYTNHPELGLGERPIKVLVTGHSLGGAGANLVAAQLNLESGHNTWLYKNITPDDVYAYTFGALDSICTLELVADSPILRIKNTGPVTDGFTNIINIYNYLDTCGENGKVAFVFSLGKFVRGNTMWGKFGVFYTYSNNMMEVVNYAHHSAYLYPTHSLAGYLAAIKLNWATLDAKTNYKRVSIHCPVDVEIYDGDTLVCCVSSESITTESPDIDICVANGEKTFLLPDDKDYRIIITATDGGTMDYHVTDLNPSHQMAVEYTDITLESGKRMLNEIGKKAVWIMPSCMLLIMITTKQPEFLAMERRWQSRIKPKKGRKDNVAIIICGSF